MILDIPVASNVRCAVKGDIGGLWLWWPCRMSGEGPSSVPLGCRAGLCFVGPGIGFPQFIPGHQAAGPDSHCVECLIECQLIPLKLATELPRGAALLAIRTLLFQWKSLSGNSTTTRKYWGPSVQSNGNGWGILLLCPWEPRGILYEPLTCGQGWEARTALPSVSTLTGLQWRITMNHIL